MKKASVIFMVLATVLGSLRFEVPQAQAFTQQVFNSSGTFNVPAGVTHVTVLIVAGGGGGGTWRGGGGGAGGVVYNSNYDISALGSSISVTVGSGGSGGNNSAGSDGGNSSFGPLTATGGGGGGKGENSNNGGRNGGSGGGRGGASTTGTQSPGTGTAGQGNNGGNSNDNSSLATPRAGGGGGGAGAVGSNAGSGIGGNGGVGVDYSAVFGTSVGASGWFGGGGGGSTNDSGSTQGSGGTGGGGGGNASGNATAGTANTGGGGGGAGGGANSPNLGGNGGSGVVIVKYATPQTLSNFADAFTDTNGKLLETHAPNTGSAWNRLLTVGGGDERLEIQSNRLTYSSTCIASEGVLYRTNDTFDRANYEVSIDVVQDGAGTDDTSILAARIQDANNMYAVEFNNSDSDIFRRVSGTWTNLGDGPGVADGSTVKLVVDGNQISFVDDGVTVIGPITDNSHSSAGYAGVGIGAVITSGDDCDSQILDNFDVTTILPKPTGVSASAVSNNTSGYRVTFNGSANPNGYATTAHFRVFTSNPGNCNTDSGGTRFPILQANDISIGSGTTSQNFSYTIPLDSGVFLDPATTYWYCSYAINSYGTTGSGSVQSFTTIDGQTHPCDAPSSGNLTIPSGAACTFNGLFDGVDSGDGTTNNAVLDIQAGSSITLNPGQKVGRGTIRTGGSISSADGSSLVKGGIFVHDKDGDGILDSKTQYVGSTASAATEFVRRNSIALNYSYSGKIASSGASLDCDPNNANYYRYQLAYVDSDNDGYGGTAASVGPNNPSANTTNSTVGTVTWSNGDRSYTSNGSYATASLASGNISYYLRATGFGFSIPNGATITGVKVEIERHASGTTVSDYSVRLYNGGYTNGINKASSTAWATSDPNTYVTYGGDGDTWGIALTEANVESSNFGVILAVQNQNASSRTISVDHIRVTVYYSSGTLQSVCSGSAYPTGYAAANNDCSPADANAYQTDSTLYTDGDGDGIVGASQYSVCKGSSTPSGWQASSGSDCSDTSRGRTTNRTCYADLDNDTYSQSSSGSYCVGSSCTATIDGQASGYFSSASSPADCYDGDANVSPGQASYFTSARSDNGTFDWDCSGGITANPATTHYCTSGSTTAYHSSDSCAVQKSLCPPSGQDTVTASFGCGSPYGFVVDFNCTAAYSNGNPCSSPLGNSYCVIAQTVSCR